MRVSHFLENRNFAVDAVDVALVLDLVLFKDFDGYFVTGYNMGSLLDFAERAFSFSFADNEPSDLLAFAILLLLNVLLVFLFWIVLDLLPLGIIRSFGCVSGLLLICH